MRLLRTMLVTGTGALAAGALAVTLALPPPAVAPGRAGHTRPAPHGPNRTPGPVGPHCHLPCADGSLPGRGPAVPAPLPAAQPPDDDARAAHQAGHLGQERHQ